MTEFEQLVVQDLSVLKAQMQQLMGIGQPGRLHLLEERVETQLGEIERIRRLERFLAPQVAQLIASSDGHEGLLDSHRREVTVVFCDLRGFTAFTESTEPEEAISCAPCGARKRSSLRMRSISASCFSTRSSSDLFQSKS